MRKVSIICDCCKRKLRGFEQNYSIVISRENDYEYRLEDICQDCFDSFKYIIDNAEKCSLG